MIIRLTGPERLRLRLAVYKARHATVRRHAQWVLSAAGGLKVARLARLAGVSRPTVYRYLRLWAQTRDPEQLRSTGSGKRLARRREAGRPAIEELA